MALFPVAASDDEDGEFEYLDDDDYDEEEFDEDEEYDCGMHPDGYCDYAGSEDCDECPYRE